VANGTPQELLREQSDAEVAALMDMPRRQALRVRSLLDETSA
jgi:hypothetical protein